MSLNVCGMIRKKLCTNFFYFRCQYINKWINCYLNGTILYTQNCSGGSLGTNPWVAAWQARSVNHHTRATADTVYSPAHVMYARQWEIPWSSIALTSNIFIELANTMKDGGGGGGWGVSYNCVSQNTMFCTCNLYRHWEILCFAHVTKASTQQTRDVDPMLA